MAQYKNICKSSFVNCEWVVRGAERSVLASKLFIDTFFHWYCGIFSLSRNVIFFRYNIFFLYFNFGIPICVKRVVGVG